jgi:hypothetical protein
LPSLVGVTLAKVEAHHAGAAAGTMTATQQFAGALGVAGVGGIFFAALGNEPSRRAYERAMQDATAVNIALVGLMIVGFLLLGRIHRKQPKPVSPDN